MKEIEVKLIGPGRCPIHVKPEPVKLPPYSHFAILDYIQITDPDGERRLLSDAEKKRYEDFMRHYVPSTMPVYICKLDTNNDDTFKWKACRAVGGNYMEGL